MINLSSIKNYKLSSSQVKNIIKLKNTHWKYSLLAQKEFLKRNYKRNDFHNLLFFKKKLIGYTGFRNYNFYYKKKIYKYLYFDCLIISKKYRKDKFSKLIMNFNEYTIKKKGLPSILFCEKNLINFYKKFNWKVIGQNKLKLPIKKKPKKIVMQLDLSL